jgi:hypothetical protein
MQGIRTEEARLRAEAMLLPPGSTASLDAGSTPTTWTTSSARRGHCITQSVAPLRSAVEHGPIGRTPSASGRRASPHRMECFYPSADVHLPPQERTPTTRRGRSPRGRRASTRRTPWITQLEEAVRTAVDAHLPAGRRSSSMWKNKIGRPYRARHPLDDAHLRARAVLLPHGRGAPADRRMHVIRVEEPVRPRGRSTSDERTHCCRRWGEARRPTD